MAERKIINLDDLIPDTQYVVLDGVEHPVEPASVDMYLQVMKKHSRIKSADTEVVQMEQSIDLIVMACPTIPRERLGRLPLKALMRLADIIQEQMTETEEGEVEPEAEVGTGE